MLYINISNIAVLNEIPGFITLGVYYQQLGISFECWLAEATTRQFFLNNRVVEHCWKLMEYVQKGSGPCGLHGTTCTVENFDESLYVLGFTCKNFSTDNCQRFRITCCSQLFQGKFARTSLFRPLGQWLLAFSLCCCATPKAKHAAPFLQGSRHIRERRPKPGTKTFLGV